MPGKSGEPLMAEAARVRPRATPRGRAAIIALVAGSVVSLVIAASASATCERPPNTVWTGEAKGPNQTNHFESFVKVEPETPPGSEQLEFSGRTSVTGEYELKPGERVPEAFTGPFAGSISCSGAENFYADLEGNVGNFKNVKAHVVYTGLIQGTDGSGNWENPGNGEKGTWTASLFAVAESAGSRPGEVEMVNPSSSVATSLTAETVSNGLPTGLVAPVGSLSYEVTELHSSTFDITFKLPPGSHPTGAYKLVGGEYIPYPPEKTKIEGEQVTLELQDNGPYDEDGQVGTLKDPVVPVAADVPEFGRCVKAPTGVVGGKTISLGKYMGPTCVSRSATQTGKYEWHSGVLSPQFETNISPTTIATLETPARAKVTCTGEHTSGEVTGAKTVGNVVLRLTGCESGGQKCSTGFTEGEIETNTLEGVLGLEKVTVKSGKETRKAGLDLYPVGKTGAFAEYTCTGGLPTTLSGSIIAPVPTNKMFTTAAVKDVQSKGRQKPERFVGGAQDVLRDGTNQFVGLGFAATQTNKEAFEINAVY
jgi:hypothetical protein